MRSVRVVRLQVSRAGLEYLLVSFDEAIDIDLVIGELEWSLMMKKMKKLYLLDEQALLWLCCIVDAIMTATHSMTSWPEHLRSAGFMPDCSTRFEPNQRLIVKLFEDGTNY